MSSRSLGTLTVDLVAKTGGFIQGMDKAERSSRKWKRSVEKDLSTITKTARNTALALGTTLVGSVTALTISGLKSADSQAKLAKSLNTTFDSVSQLNRAFSDAGIDGYESSLNRLNRRLGAAELGRGAALNAVKELNLDLKELASMDAADRVATIADRIKDVATNSQTAARYAQDLGFEQREAADFFLQGGDAIRQAGSYVEKMGLALSEIDAIKMENAVGTFGELKDIATATSRSFAASFAPAITAVNNALIDTYTESGNVGSITDKVVDGLVRGFAFGADAVDGLVRVTKFAGSTIATMALVGKQDVMSFAKYIIDFPVNALNTLIETLNYLPAVDIEAVGFSGLSESIDKELQLTKKAVEIALDDINGIMLKAQPSEAILKEFEKAKQEAEKNAQEMLKQRQKYKAAVLDENEDEAAGTGKITKTYLELMAAYDETAAAGLRYQQQVAEIDASTIELEDKLKLLTLAQQQFNEAIAEPEEQGYWERWLEGAEIALNTFDEMAASVLDNFSRGFGNAFEQMIFDSENFKDAMKGLAENMSRHIVNALGQMAAQWLAYQAVQLLVGKTTQSAASTALITNAQASVFQAGLNAFSSTAAIPIVGPAAAPAAMATAMGATQPMATAVETLVLAGMAHDGIDNIPADGTWLLQEGERVIDSRTNEDLKRFLDGKNGGGGGVVVNLYEDAEKAGQVEESEDDQENQVIDIFVADLMGDGRAAETIQKKFGLTPQGY